MPSVAIVGSVDENRVEELGLEHVERAEETARLIGRALASQGYKIVVYSSADVFIERDVVSGFAEIANVQTGSIKIYYSNSDGLPDFPEHETKKELFQPKVDYKDDWENSFYQSLINVDALVTIWWRHINTYRRCSGYGT